MRRCSVVAALGCVGFLGVVLLSTAGAWGCVPQPFLSITPQASGPPGTEVDVEGSNFGPGPVEVRWNGVDGPRLASTNGPNFSTKVAIPTAPTGLYVMIVLSRAVDGSVSQKAAISYSVQEQADAPAPPQPAATASAPSKSDDDSSSPVAAAGIAAGALLAGTMGGFVGARLAARRSVRTSDGRAP